MNEEPLIFTSKGNLPLADLEQRVSWEDDENNTVFTESYFLGDELVKRSVHVMAKRGVESLTGVSALG